MKLKQGNIENAKTAIRRPMHTIRAIIANYFIMTKWKRPVWFYRFYSNFA